MAPGIDARPDGWSHLQGPHTLARGPPAGPHRNELRKRANPVTAIGQRVDHGGKAIVIAIQHVEQSTVLVVESFSDRLRPAQHDQTTLCKPQTQKAVARDHRLGAIRAHEDREIPEHSCR